MPSSPEMTSRDRYISVPRLCTVIDSSCIVQRMNVPSGMHPLSAEMFSRCTWCVHRLRDAESDHCLRHGWLRLATEASIRAAWQSGRRQKALCEGPRWIAINAGDLTPHHTTRGIQQQSHEYGDNSEEVLGSDYGDSINLLNHRSS